jgi:hypothetical protein
METNGPTVPSGLRRARKRAVRISVPAALAEIPKVKMVVDLARGLTGNL